MVSNGRELKLPAPGREGEGWTPAAGPPREARAAAAAAPLLEEALLVRELEAACVYGKEGRKEREREREGERKGIKMKQNIHYCFVMGFLLLCINQLICHMSQTMKVAALENRPSNMYLGVERDR